MKALPSLLSLSRFIAAIGIAIFYFLGPLWSFVLIFFIWAGVSDFLDGWIARRYHLCTPFGAWLDHLSDKIVVTTALMILALHIDSLVVHLCCLLIINRELLALGIRAYPEIETTQGQGLQVNTLGKLKTMLQFVSLTLLILAQIMMPYNAFLLQIGQFFLVLATLMAYISLMFYWRSVHTHWLHSIGRAR